MVPNSVNRAVEVFHGTSKDTKRVKFHGDGTVSHPVVLAGLVELDPNPRISELTGIAEVASPVDKSQQQALVDTVRDVFPDDYTMATDRTGDIPYETNGIFPTSRA